MSCAPAIRRIWARWERPWWSWPPTRSFSRTGPSPYSLILLGDDMLLFEREEYDPGQGTWQRLAPGDPGRPNR